MSELRRNPRHVVLPEAAVYLAVDEPAVRALVAAGYLTPLPGGADPVFLETDLKAFVARNAENGAGNMAAFLDPVTAQFTVGAAEGEAGADPQALLDALDGRSDEMAERALDIFVGAFPEA